MTSRNLTIRVDVDPSGANRGWKSAEQSAKVFERELKKIEDRQTASVAHVTQMRSRYEAQAAAESKKASDRQVASVAHVTQMRSKYEAQAAREAAKAAQQRERAMDVAGRAAVGLGLAMAAGVGAAGKTAADFDAAMSGVEAATHASAGAMNDLRAAALEAGARTVFSASEAADAIEQLAKAGVSTEAILNGGLNGALDLAAAGTLGVGEAAEIAATAMTQFGLQGSAVPHIADLLAAAAGKAQGEVTDMGMALKQSGLVAAQMGVSIEETTGTLASFASAGLLGSDAGTSFRTMLLRLANPSEKAAGAMKDIGLQAYDAQGNFVGMESVAGQLAEGLGGVDQATRDAALATIFGSDAIRAANVLYEQGASGIAGWTDKVNDAGYAQETAAIKLDNLKGDIEAFMGSVETALIKTGESGDGLARHVVQNATDIVNSYSNMEGAAQTATLVIGGTVGATALAAGGFLLLAPRIAETRKAMAQLATDTPRTSRAMHGLGKALGAFAAFGTVSAVLDGIIGATSDTAEGVEQMTSRILMGLASVDAGFRSLQTWGTEAQNLEGALRTLADPGLANRLGDLGGEILSFGGNEGSYKRTAIIEQLEGMGTALAQLASGGQADLAAEQFRVYADEADAAGMSTEGLLKLMPAYAEYLASVENETTLAAGATSTAAGATGEFTAKVENATEALQAQADALRAQYDPVFKMQQAMEAHAEAQAAVAAATKQHGSKSKEAEAAQWDLLSSTVGLTAASDELMGAVAAGTVSVGDSKAQLARWVEQGLITKGQADKLAAGIAGVTTKAEQLSDTPAVAKVSETGAAPTKAKVDSLYQSVVALDRLAVTVPVTVTGVGNFLADLSRAGSAAARPIKPVNPLLPPGLMGRARGGVLPGSPSDRDNMLIAAASGEFVVNARQTARYRGVLEAINGGTLPGFAAGGGVGSTPGGRVSATDARSLTGAARGLTSVEQIRALVAAWEAYNEQLEQAARRQELFNTLAQAMADRKVAKGAEQIAQTTREVNDARKALSDFDFAAARDRESAAVQRQIDALEKQAEAEEMVAAANREANQLRTEQQDNRFELGITSSTEYLEVLRRRMADEIKHSDAWTSLYRQREQILKDQANAEADLTEKLKREYDERVEALTDLAEAAADAQDRTVDRLNDLLDQQDAVRGRQVQAERDYALQVQQIRQEQAAAEQGLARDTAAARQALMLEQERILGARRTQLASWARLDEQVGAGWGNTVEQLLLNARAQARQFEDWMGELATARARGVSEDVLTALGLDEGPQALGQLRQFNAATVDEVQALNAEVARRTTLAGQQTSREQQAQLGALGRELLAAQERYVDTLTELQARFVEEQAALDEQLTAAQTEFVVEQAEFATELAAIGQEQGRSYSDALAAGITAGIPAIAAAAEAARAATASLAAAQAALAAAQTAAPTAAGAAGSGGILDSPFKRGGILNPYIRDLGGPLLPGYTFNGTGRPETVLGPGMSAGPQTVNVQVFVGDREITDIVDVRLSNRLTAQQTAHQVAGARG